MVTPLSILVVDDHQDNRELLRLLLQARGITYSGAGDGLEGLELAARVVPDLILLDLEMPRMDGFGLLTELKRNPALRHIPVIILTATYLEAASVERGLSLGADEYLTKPINPEELLVRIQSVVRARRAERQLHRLRKDFSSMLVHDLRAPLEGVGLALNLLSTEEFTPDESHELLTMARDQIRDLSQMIEGLMELYRVESDVALTCVPLGLEQLVHEIVGEFSLLARNKGLALVTDLQAAAEVMGDRAMLKRVLANLVGNALKFTVHGQIVVRLLSDGRQAVIEIEDTGPGVPAEEVDRLFDKYFHTERRKERPERGFGLGLAFCKAAVEQHGGVIGVRSRLGQGSVFWFRLPALDEPAEPIRTGSWSVPNG